jgi:acid phosphatase (class A)
MTSRPFCFQKLTLIASALVVIFLTSQRVEATPFITPKNYNITDIIPPPPQSGTKEFKTDSGYLKNALATSTQAQIDRAKTASHDSIFDYSETLGSWFNSSDLPKTTALFNKVDQETKAAIIIAKNHFTRARPLSWHETGDAEKSNGYSYPSGHTTRAFVWADLLANTFPDMEKPLHRQARQKAWYRVILGRHFPADVQAGKLYGKFLAAQFLKSPAFQKPWATACAEMHQARKKETSSL